MSDLTTNRRIKPPMWRKAMRVIHEDCHAAWQEENILPNGRKRKKHRPYSVPARAAALVKALGKDDAEAVSALLLWAPNADLF